MDQSHNQCSVYANECFNSDFTAVTSLNAATERPGHSLG